MTIPLDYLQRIALAKGQAPAILRKQTPPTFAELVHRNMDLGMNPDAAWALAGQQAPDAYQAYLMQARETKSAPVEKTMDTAQHVVVTHPPGVAKSADGTTLKSWDEQVRHWKTYPGTYERYRDHFRTVR